MLFIGSTLLVLGGRTNTVGQAVSLDAYDTETSEWFKFPAVLRFRHVSWSFDGNIFVHGGFEHEAPNVPTDTTVLISAVKLLVKHPHLLPNQLSENEGTIGSIDLDTKPRISPMPRITNKTPEIRLSN
jgi:hypothetical protein